MGSDAAPKAPPVIEQFLRQLVIANKAVSLYPVASAIPRETAEQCLAVLRRALLTTPEIVLVVGKRTLFFDSLPVFPEQSAFIAFASELYLRRLADVTFTMATQADDLLGFLSVVQVDPAELGETGGFERRLWDAGITAIRVSEAQVTLVEADAAAVIAEQEARQEEPQTSGRTRSEIDAILAAAYGGRQRDQVVIARVIGDSEAVRDYLDDTLRSGEGGFDIASAGERFAELAQIAQDAGGGDGQELFRSLADALRMLDEEFQRELLTEELLPEARTSEALARVIRELGLDDACRMIVGSMAQTEVSRDALARAVRNLVQVSMAERHEVLASAGAAMIGAGLDEQQVAEILEDASPTHLSVAGSAVAGGAPGPRPVDTVLQLLAITPGARSPLHSDDQGVRDLQEEARTGVTDGDVIDTLITLVSLDPRPMQFASTMSTLEDALGVLVDRGEFEAAAAAASRLKEASEDSAFTPEQRTRLRQAIGRFSRPGDVRALARTLQLFSPSTSEYKAARRLLDALGAATIQPLLELLADEQSMAARKGLVDLLSEMAPGCVRDFGAYVSDPRWFFVRNVVTILGATKSPESLPYLERTLRHPEARVRRETIRALCGNNDRLAAEMLIAALSDENAQNVQLAARYLGTSGERGSIPALQEAAAGEGRGNRENGPRVEAIVALGRLGATEALPMLEAMAGKRHGILRGAKTRELRAAAESAITQIRAKGVTR